MLRARKALLPLLSVLFAGLAAPAYAVSPDVVISQVFGGGGNSGANLNSDYIQLVNTASHAVTLNGYSLQYGSASGTSTFIVAPLPASITLAPGQSYLVQGATGTNGTALPVAADATVSLNLSGTAGKIALVSNTVQLSGACPTSASIVDFVGYGSANCSEGNAPAPPTSSTLADLRNNICVDTDNNAADFSAATPAPKNAASAATPCGSATGISATGAANPASVEAGSSTLLTVAVTPGPVSTGIQVVADLSAIGGSAAQTFYDDGSNGDVTAGDNVFSYNVLVGSGAAANSVALPISVTDNEAESATTNISLTVTPRVQALPIHTIQGETPNQSPYTGQRVQTSGIVIGVRSTGFFLEARDADEDSDPATPEGIFVYTGSSVPATAVVGNELQVTGKVSEYPTTSVISGTELDSPSVTLLSTSNALPAAIPLTAAATSPSGTAGQLLRYESMRVTVAALTTTSGTGGSLTESAETNRSNGLFYGVISGIARPFREPGLDVTDPDTANQPAGIPRFDGNPERLVVDSDALGGTAIDLTSNTSLVNLAGVLDFSFGDAALDLDPTNHPTVTGGMGVVAVPAAGAKQFTVGSFNLERFYNATADTPGAVTVTAEAYARRLAKASLAIRNVLLTPDILGVEEMENLQTLTDLATKISADAQAAGQADPQYQPYLEQGNDPSAINVGFLVKATRVDVTDVTQYGKDATYINPANGQTTELNDRPPLVLHAGVKRDGGADYPVTVIVNHLRSLIDVDSPTGGATVRAKREAQAEFLADLIQGFQQSGEHIVSVGDYNAFEFSDGYVDTVGAIRGNPASADQVVLASPANLVSPNLVELALNIQHPQRYSYVEGGSAQVLDHVLVTPDLASAQLVYARLNADFPLVDLDDASTPMRVSDHDGAVAYFPLPDPPTPVTLKLADTTLTYPQPPIYSGTVQTKPGVAPPTGTVSIQSDGRTVATARLVNGKFGGVALPPLDAGTHALVAMYGGDGNYPAGQSAATTVTVSPASTRLTLNCAPSVRAGSSDICLATVIANGLLPVTGTLSYSVDGVSSSAPLTLGLSVFTTPHLVAGSHIITAIYAGTRDYLASQPGSFKVTVR